MPRLTRERRVKRGTIGSAHGQPTRKRRQVICRMNCRVCDLITDATVSVHETGISFLCSYAGVCNGDGFTIILIKANLLNGGTDVGRGWITHVADSLR